MFFKFCLVDLAIYMGKDETLQLKTKMRAINPAVVGPFTTLTGMPVQSAHEAHGFTMFFSGKSDICHNLRSDICHNLSTSRDARPKHTPFLSKIISKYLNFVKSSLPYTIYNGLARGEFGT